MQNMNELLEQLNKALGSDEDVELLASIVYQIKNKVNYDNQEMLGTLVKEVISKHEDMINANSELKEAMKELNKAVADNKLVLPEVLDVNVKNQKDEVTVKNLKDIVIPEFPKKMEVSNMPNVDYRKDLGNLAQLMGLVAKILNDKDIKVNMDRYTDPKRPLAVRMSDGRNFYTAMANAVSHAIGEAVPNWVKSGQMVIAIAGTAQQLPNMQVTSITVKAKTANTGVIYVGGADVDSSTGFILEKGESISLMIDNANRLYLDSSVNGEGVTFVGVTSL